MVFTHCRRRVVTRGSGVFPEYHASRRSGGIFNCSATMGRSYLSRFRTSSTHFFVSIHTLRC
jgi:hypothetical protein